MKRIIALFTTLAATINWVHAIGTVNFANQPSTLISVGGAVMPTQSVQQFNFAVFLAPSSTVAVQGITPALADPVFQLAAGYTANHVLAPATGRLLSIQLDVGPISGFAGGDHVDFVVRGWSANLGSTWAVALANWNDGNPLIANSAMGSSTIGNDLLLGDGGPIPATTLFGAGADQIAGFNLVVVPEPSIFALSSFGAAAALLFRRRLP